MTDSPHRGGGEQSGFPDGPNPPQPLGNTYPAYTDPAYASQAPYGPAYQAPAAPAPTEQLPRNRPTGTTRTPNGPVRPVRRAISARRPGATTAAAGRRTEVAPLAVGARRYCCAGGDRSGDRLGHRLRQQFARGDGRRAAAVADGAQLPYPNSADDDLPQAHDSGVPAADGADECRRCDGADGATDHRLDGARPHGDRGLQRQR